MKNKPKIEALPTLHMSKRSHDASSRKYYQSFNDLCKRIKTLKTLNDWIVQELGYASENWDSLGWLLPEDHELYTTNLRSITSITVSDPVESRTLSLLSRGETIWIVKQYRASFHFLSKRNNNNWHKVPKSFAEFCYLKFQFIQIE